jgi:hypothetical protein
MNRHQGARKKNREGCYLAYVNAAYEKELAALTSGMRLLHAPIPAPTLIRKILFANSDDISAAVGLHPIVRDQPIAYPVTRKQKTESIKVAMYVTT